MIKKIIICLGIIFLGLVIYSLLPKPWTNQLESRLYWRAFLNNEKGLRAFEAKDLGLATNQWAEALSTSPGLMPLHYNLGLGWQLMSRSDEALKSYNFLLKSPQAEPALKFDSNFNMGALFQAGKQVDSALSSYQAALNIEPQSRETKINIELLIQQQQGGGKGENKDQSQGSKGDQDQKQDPGKDEKDKDKPGQNEQEKEEKKEYAKNPKPEKPQFNSEQLSQSDVNKILGEIKQQEQKIRAEYNKKESKEQPRDKDW